MAVTRTIWKNAFAIENIPEWTCPSCSKGSLKGGKQDFQVFESASSLAARQYEEWEHEWIRGTFYGVLTCSNSSCQEKIIITGDMGVSEEPDYSEEYNGLYNFTLVEHLTPRHFIPSLSIFHVQKDLPENIKELIQHSFNLYWVDTSSCANKIRIVVELIMDEQKVAKTYIDRGKRKGHSLHKRIELLKATKLEEGELFMAVKWIGNSGSHSADGLTKDDLLDAYEILEHVTTKLYEKDSHRIKSLSKTINKRKKPIGTKRVKKR